MKVLQISVLLTLLIFATTNGIPTSTASPDFIPLRQRNNHVAPRSHDPSFQLLLPELTNLELLSKRIEKQYHIEATNELNRRFQIIHFSGQKIASKNQMQIFSEFLKRKNNDDERNWTPQMVIAFTSINHGNYQTNPNHHPAFIVTKHQIPFSYEGRIIHFTKNFPTISKDADGVIIPKMFEAYVSSATVINRYKIPNNIFSSTSFFEPDTKLVLIFSTAVQKSLNFTLSNSPNSNSSTPVTLCFVHTCLLNRVLSWEAQRIIAMITFLSFRGKNIEVSTLNLKDISNKIRIKRSLLEWKEKIDFLDTHQIIAFEIPESQMADHSISTLFNETFGIKPLSLKLFNQGRKITVSHTYLNNTNILKTIQTTSVLYVIVGFLKAEIDFKWLFA